MTVTDKRWPAYDQRGELFWAITNAFTCATIFFGFVLVVVPTGIPEAMARVVGAPASMAPLILCVTAVFCDIADGKLARALGVQSQIGAVFDGIADMMAFGIGPAIYFANQVLGQQPPGSNLAPLHVAAVTAYVVAAVYRISRFLVLTFDSRVVNFRGMPTNVAGCCLHAQLWLFGVSHWAQVWAMFFLAYMMVSKIEFSKPGFLM